jgi:hypothetical protein
MSNPRVEFYEVWVEGEPKWRDLAFNRDEADRIALRIAEDELATVEVRPIGVKP